MTDKKRDAEPTSADEGKDTWYLEDVYPDADVLLQIGSQVEAKDASALVVFDTNVVSHELPKLIDVYRELIRQERLFIPHRVIREFVKNRDHKLGEIL